MKDGQVISYASKTGNVLAFAVRRPFDEWTGAEFVVRTFLLRRPALRSVYP